MNTEKFHRKITAILSADVQGYSRLMGEDEENTVRTLTAYRELMSSLIRDHRGHVVDTPGDNLLAKFGSVTDAVRCAVEIQEELRIRNADLPENRRMQFRIGINLGDVIEEGDRIYGDGINVAARLEGLAEGGGICVSGFVYGAIKNKLSFSFEFMGEHSVKNIKDPVRVYRIRMDLEDATPKAPVMKDVEEAPKTIAVLPFVNLSSDPEQEYFVDGLSEELLNCLAKINMIKVTSRTSSFALKNTGKTLQEVANVLSVAHILEGSVRKAGDMLRITAQLIRVKDDSHLWSETYNRELKDIFAVQEDIATAVADELKVKLGIDSSYKILGGTDNEKAYELYLVSRGLFGGDPTALSRALESIDAAVAADPEFAMAWAMKAMIHNIQAVFVPIERSASEHNEGLRSALRAIEIEPRLAEAYAQLGFIRTMRGDFVEAELAYIKARELKTLPLSENGGYPLFLLSVGHLKRAHDFLEADRQNDPLNQPYRAFSVLTHTFLNDPQRAENEYERGLEMFGDQWKMGSWFITLARLGVGKVVLSDDIPDISIWCPIDNAAKEHMGSPEEGLGELRRLYADHNQSAAHMQAIAVWAAHYGDAKFAMDVMEKVIKLNATSCMHLWYPKMREIRQSNRFKKFIREIGLVDYWEEFGWPDICRPTENGDFVCD